MSRIKKPRTKRRTLPHGICALPIMFRFNAEDERLLQLVPHQELAKMIAGDGDATSWHTITARLNIGLTLARKLFGDPETIVMAHALDSICDVRDRFQRVGKYGVSGDEAKRIGAGLVLVDDLQKNCTRRECRDAINHVMGAMA